MQENEFEKQVQQKMDELKLHPSETVWPKIESQIKKEKRRRWGVIIFVVIIIAALYGVYLQLNKSQSYTSQNEKQQIKPATKTTNEITTRSFDSAKTQTSIIKNEKRFDEQTASTLKRTETKKVTSKGKIKSSINYRIANNTQKDTATAFVKPGITKSIAQNENINSDKETLQQEKILRNNDKPDSSADKSEQFNLLKNNTTQESKTDTPKKKITAPQKHSWNWGITLAGGMSGIKGVKGIFGNEDKSANFTSQVSSTPGTGVTYSMPPITSSIAFIAGFTAEKKLSPKIAFATGFNYKLLNTKNSVGNDSLRFYYSSGNAGIHHNFFHYLELPVGIKLQLTNKKVPLYWNISSFISFLAGSNALQYNTTTHLYYHDNSQLNKIQFGFNTGFDIDLMSKQKSSLLLGPVLNYSISKIAAQGYNNHHFTFIGLRLQLLFKK